ncbi:MAG: 1,4-dihydroxy-2-naphthoate polyprenyltransferase [Actinomycetota bacterium]|nr:1,4-dihydroxy-2-naphthoate polyprenyltransferase [Actinomycetota bacterium]
MNVWVEASRPRTLPAAVVPVAVGTAVATAEGVALSLLRAGLALLVALALQVGVNFANDLFDGLAGIDTENRVGPRRVVAAGLVTPLAMKRALAVTLAVAAVAGLALALLVDPWLLLIGAIAIVATLGYSGGRRPYASRALGELSVFVFFGLVATVGSAYVQSGRVSALAIAASLPVGLLAVGLLMINNVRDVDTDAATGKRTLAVRVGARTYGHTFGWLLIVAFVLLAPVAWLAGSAWPLLALLALPLVAQVAKRSRIAARTEGARERGAAYVAALGATARLQLAFGLLLTVGLVLA